MLKCEDTDDAEANDAEPNDDIDLSIYQFVYKI
jgi:hypothetical protein